MSLEIGQQAPDFTLENQDGENVSLSDFKGKNVVLYFYPKDMTPGCTTEACDFRDHHETFTGSDTVILGISPDPIEKHQQFIEKHGLPFTLLADVNKEAAKAYGVLKQDASGIDRSTFIIDKKGVLQKEYRQVKVDGHAEEVLNYVQNELS